MTGRVCYALEPRRPSVDVAVQRWERFTGKQAVVAMATATKAEIERRIAEIVPSGRDCLTLREIRAMVNAKTAWGATISDAQLKYYIAAAREQMTRPGVDSTTARSSASPSGVWSASSPAPRPRATCAPSWPPIASNAVCWDLPPPTHGRTRWHRHRCARQQLAENIAAEMAAHENETKEHHGNASTDK